MSLSAPPINAIIIWKYDTPSLIERLFNSTSLSRWVCIYHNQVLPDVKLQMNLLEYYQLYPEMKQHHQAFLSTPDQPTYSSLMPDGYTILIDKPVGIANCFYECHYNFHLTNNLQLLKLINNKIREPLSSLVGAIILSEDQEWTSEQRKILDIIKASNYKLMSLVNDLVDVIDIIHGNIKINLHALTIGKLVTIADHIIHMMQARASQRHITYQIKAPPTSQLEQVITVDQARLKQILIYLIDNTILYSRPHTTVSIDIKVNFSPSRRNDNNSSSGRNDNGQCQIIVSNQSHQCVVIDHTKGFGIYIAKKLTHLMSGTLTYQIDFHQQGQVRAILTWPLTKESESA